MNAHRLSGIFLCVAAVLFSFSCNNQSSEEKSSADSTTTADTTTASTATTAPSTNTITTTEQNMMVVTHKVKDFTKWKTSYDANDSLKLAYGVHNYVVGQALKDSGMVLVAVKVDDLNKAKEFAKSASLKQAMQKGGVVGPPTIKFTTMVWQDTGTISTDLRSRTTFSVKDWDKWRSSFDSSRQDRLNNGIQDRAYGHDAGDNHKVIVVVALTDTTKAQAYWKSDALKQRMTASGVIGQPQRFLYRMVQRY